MRALVVGGSPDRSSTELLKKVAGSCGYIVAVDGGIDALREAGVVPHLFCGDADSSSPAMQAAICSQVAVPLASSARSARCKRSMELESELAGTEIELYDVHKDATDLDLALKAILERLGPVDIVCMNLSGGRPDHYLAALGRLCAWRGRVKMVEDGFVGTILHAGEEWDVGSYQGATFSFIPLSTDCVVSESAMRWELDHASVPLLSDLGISNELDYPHGVFTCHSGTVGAWVIGDGACIS